MLSIDLFDSQYEKKLHEGAVDDTIEHLIKPLSLRAADIRTQLRSRRLDPKQIDKLEKEYEELVQKRLDIILDRRSTTQEQQVPTKQDQFGRPDPFARVQSEPKGIGDVQDPRQKMAQLQQKAKKGPLANVGAGLKAFLKGEPEPMDEEQQEINPRALGVANFQRLLKANMGNIPTVSLEFIRPEENFKLDQKGLDLISDYYDSLENDQAKNYFIYRVLPSGDETRSVLMKLGWSPQVQQPLPGISTQGELPLSEKKKSNDNSDIEAGDVKVARELQKLRAEYPAARSDVEAVARAEIDSAERSRQQLSAVRGANTRQDELLKQLVDLDQEQGREIDNLDKENDSLEQRLLQIARTNDRLQQTIGQMTGTKKSATAKVSANQGSNDVARGGIIDVGGPAVTKTTPTDEPGKKPPTGPITSPAIDSMAKTIKGFAQPAPSLQQSFSEPAPASMRRAANDGKTDQLKKAAESKIKEHGGGIGPRQHWQSMMQEGAVKRALYDYKIVTDAEFVDKYKMTKREFYNEVINAGKTKKPYKAPQACPQCGKAHESCVCESTVHNLAMSKNIIPRKSVIQGYTVFWNPTTKTVSVTRGGDSEEAAIEQARLGVVNLKSFRLAADRLIDRINSVTESALKDKADLAAKRKALQDLSMNQGVDQQAVQQRKLDLEKEAEAKGLDEGWSGKYVAQQTGRPRTPYSVYINGKKWKDFENDDHARAVMDKLKAKFKADGRDPSVITIAPTDIPEGVAEAEKEPTTRQELLNRVDKIQRMMSQDRNPANLQILRKELEMLKQRYQHLKEDNDSEAVEIAVIKRILVSHLDLIMQFGLDKVTDAIEEVAYNVGDVDEIGTSDVSAYVAQVKQILGAEPQDELNEKWSAKYKSSINCAAPKGFSQKAHCAGKKK